MIIDTDTHTYTQVQLGGLISLFDLSNYVSTWGVKRANAVPVL